jgi:thiamine kinase-like enzyme
LQRGLSFDVASVLSFYQRLLQPTIFVHNDWHPRNVMKNAQGQFKLIDFDRMTIINPGEHK